MFVVPLPAPASWPYIFGSIIAHLRLLLPDGQRVPHWRPSLVYPLMRGVAPLITAVLGILWLRELPAPISWLGMLMISFGVIALALRPTGDAPVLAGHGRAVGFALANAAVIAAYTIIDGTGARLAGDPWAYIVWLFVLDSIPFSIYMLATESERFAAALVERRWHGLIGGALSAAAYAISVWAMTKAPVALVASLRETSVLFATLIGARLLKEKLTPRRWAGVGGGLIGVVALKAA